MPSLKSFWAVLAVSATLLAGSALPAAARGVDPSPSPASPPSADGTPAALPAIPAKGIKAVLVRSWGACGSGSPLVWDALNANWSSYGTVPISIDYSNQNLCSESFTLGDLEASKADVVILSDPAGAGNHFTADEITALKTYANDGHDLIATYATFAYTRTNNTALAPLFGLATDVGWTVPDRMIDPTYTLRPHKLLAKRLIRDVPDPFVSTGYDMSQTPGDGRWSSNDLAGATIVGVSRARKAAITVYRADVYRAIYISTMPEYGGGTADQQLLYNAIIYPKTGL